MAEAKGNFLISRKICGKDIVKIRYDGLQACDYLKDLNFQKLYGSDVEPDLGNAFEFHKFIRIDVLGEPPSKHMFFSQHCELIFG